MNVLSHCVDSMPHIFCHFVHSSSLVIVLLPLCGCTLKVKHTTHSFICSAKVDAFYSSLLYVILCVFLHVWVCLGVVLFAPLATPKHFKAMHMKPNSITSFFIIIVIIVVYVFHDAYIAS